MKKFMYVLMAAAAILAVSCKKGEDPENNNQEPAYPTAPYAALTQASAWGLTGSIASVGINWDSDIETLTDGTWHVAKAVSLTATDEFKFRKDHDWAENFGGNLTTVGELFDVSQNGPNMKVPADGVYDIILNTETSKVVVVASK